MLEEQEAGATAADLCRNYGISEATFYNWEAKKGGMEVSNSKRLKALEDENARLKKSLAAQMLDAVAKRGAYALDHARRAIAERADDCYHFWPQSLLRFGERARGMEINSAIYHLSRRSFLTASTRPAFEAVINHFPGCRRAAYQNPSISLELLPPHRSAYVWLAEDLAMRPAHLEREISTDPDM